MLAIVIVAYSACALAIVAADRLLTRGRCPECRGRCIHRDWPTSVLMGAVWPLTLVLFGLGYVFGEVK